MYQYIFLISLTGTYTRR